MWSNWQSLVGQLGNNERGRWDAAALCCGWSVLSHEQTDTELAVHCSLYPGLSFVPDQLPRGAELLQTHSQLLVQFTKWRFFSAIHWWQQFSDVLLWLFIALLIYLHEGHIISYIQSQRRRTFFVLHIFTCRRFLSEDRKSEVWLHHLFFSQNCDRTLRTDIGYRRHLCHANVCGRFCNLNHDATREVRSAGGR